mmetsp:Transcript_61877/g.164456  ORF Transcript_61877/g.164456 Transcript_61877/m.164456 type:complete len:265 (+) Transcript_61877:135-929(+)
MFPRVRLVAIHGQDNLFHISKVGTQERQTDGHDEGEDDQEGYKGPQRYTLTKAATFVVELHWVQVADDGTDLFGHRCLEDQLVNLHDVGEGHCIEDQLARRGRVHQPQRSVPKKDHCDHCLHARQEPNPKHPVQWHRLKMIPLQAVHKDHAVHTAVTQLRHAGHEVDDLPQHHTDAKCPGGKHNAAEDGSLFVRNTRRKLSHIPTRLVKKPVLLIVVGHTLQQLAHPCNVSDAGVGHPSEHGSLSVFVFIVFRQIGNNPAEEQL